MVSCLPDSIAIFSLVPTPSVVAAPLVLDDPDLRLVPRRSFAMASARAADLWAHPGLARLWQQVVAKELGAPPTFATFDAAGRELQAATSLAPADVERLTVVMRTFDDSPLGSGIGVRAKAGPVLIVRTT